WIAPAPPILVPEQGWAVRRLTDHVARAERSFAETQALERCQRWPPGDEVGEERVGRDVDEAARRPLLGTMLRRGGIQHGAAVGAQVVEHGCVEHTADDAVPVREQQRSLLPCRRCRRAFHSLPFSSLGNASLGAALSDASGSAMISNRSLM